MEKKIKENAIKDYLEMVKKSWTYKKLTIKEKENFYKCIEWADRGNCIKGNYHTRWNILHAIYHSFLIGIGYTDFNWRE